jgi:putative peptidoglycan lipid II flippase
MLRSLATVSGFTLISRILGFLRDILIARFLGAGLVMDAFASAFRFPNLFRRIFGEGAFNAAFVPMFGKKVVDDRKAGLRFASQAFSMLFAVLGVFTLIAIPAMPLLMNVVVPGFKAQEEVTLDGNGKAVTLTLRGAKAAFFEIEDGGELVLESAAFEKTTGKSLGALVGKKGETTRLPLTEPTDEEELPSGLYQTYQEPLKVGNTVAEELSEEEGQRWDRIRRDSFVVEGALWEEGRFVSLPGVDYVKISRPLGDAKEGIDYFSAKLSGEGEVSLFRNHPGTFAKTVKLSRIMFIYLLCMALAAHLSGVLNTFRIFGMPAAAPIILNVVFLGALGLIAWLDWLPGETLAWGVALAGFLQLGALWWTCRRKDAAIRLERPRMSPDIKRLFRLMGPGVASASVQQVNLLVAGIIASFQPGAISYLYFSDRVYQLPLGMIGIALGVVLLPEVSRQLGAGLERQAGKTLSRGIEFGMLLTLPAAVAMMVVPTELIAGLFQRGEFERADAVQTGRALAAFGIGLPGYVLIKILQPGYFAKGDTKNPMKMAVTMVIVNIVMSLLLFPWIGHVGLALATSIAAWVNVFMLWKGLKGFVVLTEKTIFKLGRMVCASLLMGVVLYLAAQGLQSWFEGGNLQRITAMVLIVGTGISAFGALALFLRATSVKDLKEGFGKG